MSGSQIKKHQPEESSSRITSLLYAIGQPIEKVKDLLTSDFVTDQSTTEGQRSSVQVNVESVTTEDSKQTTTTSLSQHFKKSLGYAGIFFGLLALAGILIYFDLGEVLGKGTLSIGTVTLFYVFTQLIEPIKFHTH